MNETLHSKSLDTSRLAIKGEAFFESLVAEYSLPHQIVGPKDVGIDYICEWVFGERPTGILFAAQVKTFTVSEKRRVIPKGVNKKLNGLNQYDIPHIRIKDRTLAYWKTLGMPVYVFAVAQSSNKSQGTPILTCYYK